VDLSTATLLRYRFDTVAQTRAHLHAAADGTLLFFRGGDQRPAGAQVLVELAFRDSEQVRLLRGVQARAVPGEGSWLRFAQGLVLPEVETGLLARRQHRRYGADLPIEVLRAAGDDPKGSRATGIDARPAGAAALEGRLHDLSLVGARLSGESLGLRPGTKVALRVPGADNTGPATVVWANRQGAWQLAPEAVHPRACCQAGMILEPPLPR